MEKNRNNNTNEYLTQEDLERKLTEVSEKEQISILSRLSQMSLSSNPTKTIEYCKQGIRLLDNFPDKIMLVKFLNFTCLAYQHLGNFKESLEYGFVFLDTAMKIDNRLYKATACNCIGISYWRLSGYDDALEYFHKTLEICEKLNDQPGIAGSYNNIGLIHDKMGNKEKALEYYNKALEINRITGNKDKMADILINVGVIYRHMSNYKEAIKCCRKILGIKKEINDRAGISHAYINLGVIFRELGKNNQSLEILEKALRICEETGDKYAESETALNIGMTYAALEDYGKAISFVKKGIEYARESSTKGLLTESLKELSKYFEKTGDLKNALEYFKEFKKTNDEIFDEESSKKINELEIKHKVKIREQEAEIIRQKNIELVGANNELKEALDEVKKLSGLLPICASCKKVRDDKGYWNQIESYLLEHSEVHFSHGLCPECMEKLYPELVDSPAELKNNNH